MEKKSVQLINGSDNNEREIHDISPSKTENTYGEDTLNRLQPHSRSLWKNTSHVGNRIANVQMAWHGPKYYLSVSHSGRRPEVEYVPGDYAEQVELFLSNFKKAKQLLEEISDINRKFSGAENICRTE